MFQCFVICPFGSEGRGEDEKRLLTQLEGLRKHVFEPAAAICKRRKYPVKISDVRGIEHDRDSIKEAVQECLDEAAAVVVVLSANKPNVFLELGWAQGMWQAPILLASDQYSVPADINNDLRLPDFTDAHIDGTNPEGSKALAIELAEKIIGRIKVGRSEKQFKHWPRTTLARGAVRVYNRFLHAITPEEWSKMIDSAQQEIIVASTSMSRIRGQRFFTRDATGQPIRIKFEQLLLKKALDGVAVTVLLYHPENLTLGHLKALEDGLEQAKDDLKESFKVWSTQRQIFESGIRNSPGAKGAFRVVQIRQRHLPFRVTLTERRVLATLRLYTETYNSGLLIDAVRPSHPDKENIPVYTQIRDELQYLIDENHDASEQAFIDWSEDQRRA